MVKSYTYLIKFLPTGQVYYGSRSKNVKLNLAPEQDLMVKYFTSCKVLKRLIRKHGLTAFSWQIRRRFDTSRQAADWEQKVLRRMRVLHDPKWFNQNVAGYIVPTAEGRQKISETHKDVPKSEEHRRRISEALKGKKKSAEHIANLSKSHQGHIPWNRGIPATESQKDKQREKMSGRKAWNEGIAMTQEQKDKISATKKSQVLTETQREQKRIAQKLAVEARLAKKEELRKAINNLVRIRTKKKAG